MKTLEDTIEREMAGSAGLAEGLAPRIYYSHSADEDFVDSWLVHHVLRSGLRFMRGARWYTRKRLKDLPRDLVLRASVTWEKEVAVLRIEGLVARVCIDYDDECQVHVYSDRFGAGGVDAAVEQLRVWLEPKRENSPERVQVAFRHAGSRGPRLYARRYVRSIQAPEWSEIRPNYASTVRAELETLVAFRPPPPGGRLVLFHGPPGTGKTYVVRALAREWRRWCRFEYIVDPEVFFGDAEYMMQVLLEAQEDGAQFEDAEAGSDGHWRILVIEDAGELLARDAKMRQGQGLSRLLNLSEGLVGQGLRVMTLITTNEYLQSLNEAVARPGRTAAEIEFTRLPADECEAWLAARGQADETIAGPMTLAEVFALVSGVQHRRPKSRGPMGYLSR